MSIIDYSNPAGLTFPQLGNVQSGGWMGMLSIGNAPLANPVFPGLATLSQTGIEQATLAGTSFQQSTLSGSGVQKSTLTKRTS